MKNEILEFIQEQIGYKFRNSDLLQQAFIRRSYSKENGGEDNEVLEFIGDTVLDYILVKLLVKKYGSFAEEYENYNYHEDCNEFISEYGEGKLTEIKKKLVCREMLSSRIRMFGFQHLLKMGNSDIEQKVQENESVQEDLFEAIIGAVALDSEFNDEKMTTVVDLLLDPEHYLDKGFDNSTNYVELVQQWYQKKYGRIPIYEFPKWLSWNMQRTYPRKGNVQCNLSLIFEDFHGESFEALGKSKSEARMAVAEQAYRYLEENSLLFTWIDEIGEPNIDRAINQLQELYQKGYIGEPWYDFTETYDEDGNPIWHCECHVEGSEIYFEDEYKSKKYGKKAVAYDMLCNVIGWGEDDET